MTIKMFAHSILTATSTRSKIEKENTKKNQYLQFTNSGVEIGITCNAITTIQHIALYI